MDWDRAIAINQAALTRIVAALIAMVGLGAPGVMARLPRPVYRAALRVLRPAESAVRRLIVIMAQGVAVKPRPGGPMPAGLALKAGHARSDPSFQLFDSRQRFGTLRRRGTGPKSEPRLFVFGSGPLVPLFQPQRAASVEIKSDDGMVNAGRLGRRLTALKTALENLPRQVKRLVRWQARRKRMANPKFTSPLRPGPPPGHRHDPEGELGRILYTCHVLAREARYSDSS